FSGPCLFFNEDWEVASGKLRKSRRQRRCEKFKHIIVNPEMHIEPELPLGLQIPDNIIELQKADVSLASCFQQAIDKDQVEERGVNRKEYVLPYFIIRLGQLCS
ncbi:hypothetical protein XENOCAPTIV_007959, partial [Xenoophorus captivus]